VLLPMAYRARTATLARSGHGTRDMRRRHSVRRMMIVSAAAIAAVLMAAPVAASDTVRWTDTHNISGTFSCGVVESTMAAIDGTAFFASDGSWLKDVIRFSYDASYTDPASGRTISFKTRQTIMASPETIALRGQGLFVRVPVEGAVLLDVGRLVFDPSDGSTMFVSAKALRFDDPSVPARLDAAICGMF
jgi:hypothetical protein